MFYPPIIGCGKSVSPVWMFYLPTIGCGDSGRLCGCFIHQLLGVVKVGGCVALWVLEAHYCSVVWCGGQTSTRPGAQCPHYPQLGPVYRLPSLYSVCMVPSLYSVCKVPSLYSVCKVPSLYSVYMVPSFKSVYIDSMVPSAPSAPATHSCVKWGECSLFRVTSEESDKCIECQLYRALSVLSVPCIECQVYIMPSVDHAKCTTECQLYRVPVVQSSKCMEC